MKHATMITTLLGGLVLGTTMAPPAAISAVLPPPSYAIGRVLGFRTDLVGIDLNGTQLDGAVINGVHLVGVARSGVLTAKGKVVSVSLQNSRLVAAGAGASANALENAELVGLLENGGTVPLRVLGRERSGEDGFRDVFLYDVDAVTDQGPRPLCGVDEAGARRPAIALEGRWDVTEGTATGGSWIDDPQAFTLACRGFVLAKCVEAGYKPWRKALVCEKGKGCRQMSVATLHQACTRMLRADYCGDGRSHTVDGVPVNVYDALGVRGDGEAWRPEAEWDDGGARCLAALRRPDQVPACYDELQSDTCGDPAHAADGTLIFSEIQ